MAINGLVVGFYLIHGLLAILPSYALFKQYRYTEINDYLLFCGAFISTIIMSLSFILIEYFDKLFYYQLAYITQNLFYLFLFIHAINSIWEEKPWYILGPGIVWFIFLEIYIVTWNSTADSFSFLSFSLDRSIQSDSYSMYGILYRLFVMSILMYVYKNVKPIKKPKG